MWPRPRVIPLAHSRSFLTVGSSCGLLFALSSVLGAEGKPLRFQELQPLCYRYAVSHISFLGVCDTKGKVVPLLNLIRPNGNYMYRLFF
jgi:hypothetical protein